MRLNRRNFLIGAAAMMVTPVTVPKPARSEELIEPYCRDRDHADHIVDAFRYAMAGNREPMIFLESTAGSDVGWVREAFARAV